MANMEMLKNAIDELPFYIELMTLTARQYKIKYGAFLKEGFTPEQALFLCKDK